jgi:DNA-binding transcriptional regulator YdaS (Cro superfamily)
VCSIPISIIEAHGRFAGLDFAADSEQKAAMSSQLDFYLARAAEARADAEAATLDNVRDRCLRAAAAWDAMAARAHRGDAMRARQEADKAALAQTDAAAPAQ